MNIEEMPGPAFNSVVRVWGFGGHRGSGLVTEVPSRSRARASVGA